jgi:hypothetical protein
VSSARFPGAGIYRTLAGLVLIGAFAAPLCAQTPDDPIEGAPLRLGPLGLSPLVALTDFGVDSNVFNEFDDAKRDFTFTVSPGLDAWLRAGRSRLHVAARGDLVYFHQYSSERSLDGSVASRLDVRSARVNPWFTAAAASGRQRLGYEIDLRFRRITRDVAAGVEARLAARTRVGVSVRHSAYSHQPDAVFLGSNLREALDRGTTGLGLEMRYALTPLTTWVVSGERARDRFEFTSERNADSSRLDTGFDLAPTALIAGRGRVGYRRFGGTSGALPVFSGLVASVAAGSTIQGRTRVEVTTERDVNYSWETYYPYFVLTGATLTVTPQLTPRWDVRGRTGVQRLAYRALVGVPDLLTDRVDRFELLGAGIGYRIGRDVRLGMDLDRERRTSPVRRRAYEGYRTGLSVTYGR